ncbi:MAG: putative ABC transporter permease [Candidatus Nomurabacteria bacterium]|jgi:uncharacterized membrane protein|nr:putative ABC transporter permease [Candidatus Nomurabacteria bacterium]
MGVKTKKKQLPRTSSWKPPIFWRNLLLYFLAFSYIGHFIEMGWNLLCHWVLGEPIATNILANALEPYTIYGTGAILCILVVRPLVKKFDHNIFATFLISTIVCAALECLSSVILVWRYGYNPYWWYADRTFNLGGHICLSNIILFGILATAFLKVFYPAIEKLLKKGNQRIINLLLIVLVILFSFYYLMLVSIAPSSLAVTKTPPHAGASQFVG